MFEVFDAGALSHWGETKADLELLTGSGA